MFVQIKSCFSRKNPNLLPKFVKIFFLSMKCFVPGGELLSLLTLVYRTPLLKKREKRSGRICLLSRNFNLQIANECVCGYLNVSEYVIDGQHKNKTTQLPRSTVHSTACSLLLACFDSSSQSRYAKANRSTSTDT